ncbi:hypothetical protein AALA36_09635 [Lachnospiraceae bacterium 66-29]
MENFIGQYFKDLQQIALHYLLSNYDYCYLDAMHEKNRTIGSKTIISGSSHAMNGIVETELPKGTINFSISSQDLYFDFLNIKKAIEEGKQRIENCVINIGYYMMYQDLSLSETLGYLMYRVYGPLFGDTHNYQGEKKIDFWSAYKKYETMYSEQLIHRVCIEFGRKFFEGEGSYYGSLKAREQNNLLSANGIVWQELGEEQKCVYAKKRAADHNRLKKHFQSRKENGRIVQEMTQYLYEKGIKPIFAIFPFTRFYNYYIDDAYKKDIFSLLDSLPYEVEFLDMNEYMDLFEDDDFLDTDHLNLTGARKASKLLNEFIAVTNKSSD